VVELIKERTGNVTTLAIGDGANDVNMITTAHIGIGIVGVEGRQAARASDYTIGEFSFLRRLLFVHGRESYRKNSFVVCYNFYKNALFVMPQFWFGMISIYSGQTLYDPWIYQLFNIFFAAAPIVWFGIYDKEVKASVLFKDCRYYTQGMLSKLFHTYRFWKWLAVGILQGFFLFLFFFCATDSPLSNGKYQDLWSVGSMIYAAIVLIVNFRIAHGTHTHTWISLTLFILSVGTYFVVLVIMSRFSRFENFNNDEMLFIDPKFYLTITSVVLICLVLDVALVRLLYLFGILQDPYYINPHKIDEEIKKNVDTEALIGERVENRCKIFYFYKNIINF
jgi:phospholipid-transporting ATPase